MIDPILGTLKPDPIMEGCLLGTTIHDGHEISLRVDADGADLESCLTLARNLVASLGQIERKARIVGTEQLLVSYNESWRIFQRVQRDGTLEEVEYPALSPDEFSSQSSSKGCR